jgi:hypothetical protein
MDSRGYQRVVAEKLYCPKIPITKFEYTGYVQKIMGTRLRKFVKLNAGTKP